MLQPEKRVLWHPLQRNKFIVGGGSQITLYEWAQDANTGGITQLTSLHDLQHLKCFAWSPEPTIDDLLAVGNSIGKVELIRLSPSPNSRNSNFQSLGVLPGPPSVPLNVKSTRACHALAFNAVEPSLLAAGYDKARGEGSLVIWDITGGMAALSVPVAGRNEDVVETYQPRQRIPSGVPPTSTRISHLPTLPERESTSPSPKDKGPFIQQQHLQGDTVACVQFLPSSPHLLLASISNRWLRLLDLRVPGGGALSNTANPSGTGMNPNYMPGGPPAANASAKVHGISTDPFDVHRFATFADTIVTVWDVRRSSSSGSMLSPGPSTTSAPIQLKPVLSFTSMDAAADGPTHTHRSHSGAVKGAPTPAPTNNPFTQIEFSRIRRGCLATLERDVGYVRFWDVLGWSPSSSNTSSDSSSRRESGLNSSTTPTTGQGLIPGPVSLPRRAWANLPWTGGSNAGDSTPVTAGPTRRDSLDVETPQTVLVDTRRTKFFPQSITSFTLAPPTSSTISLTTNILLLNKDSDLELYAVHDAPKRVVWSARGEMNIAAGTGCKVLTPSSISDEGHPHDRSRSRVRAEDFVDRDTADERHTDTENEDNAPAATTTNPPVIHQPSPVLGRGRERSKHLSLTADPADVPPRPAQTSPVLFGRGDEDGFPALPSMATAVTSSAGPSKKSKQAQLDDGPPRSGEAAQSGHRDHVGMGVPSGAAAISGRMVSGRAHGSVRGRRLGGSRGVGIVVEQDISMVMKRRAEIGYGLFDPNRNMHVVQESDPSSGTANSLAGIWEWIYHSSEVLSNPTHIIDNYDFSYQGLLGIWEGFPSLPGPTPLPYATVASSPQQTSLHALSADMDSPTPPPETRAGGRRTGRRGAGGPDSRNTHTPAASTQLALSDDGLSSAPAPSGTFQSALFTLAHRAGVVNSLGANGEKPWRASVPTGKSLQRQVALLLCGWKVKEDEFNEVIQKWEANGDISRAACWLVFTKQYSKAISVLLRSPDETHQMMSGLVAALSPHAPGTISMRSPELRDHCQRLITRLEDPYSRVMLINLSLSDWSEVLEEDSLPFRERLAIAFQFLEDKAVTSYLRKCTERAILRGDIDALLIPGLKSEPGIDLLQGYVDRTGDVQTAAILGSYVCPPTNMASPRRRRVDAVELAVARWVESYRDLLDGFKMFHARVGFDIERGQVALAHTRTSGYAPGPGDWVPKQIYIRCNYCNKPITMDANSVDAAAVMTQNGRPTRCPHCSGRLPRCAVCLMTLSIVQDSARESELLHSETKDTLDDAILMCQTCRHGGHAAHILDWFYGETGEIVHEVCPVADCDCRCIEEI